MRERRSSLPFRFASFAFALLACGVVSPVNASSITAISINPAGGSNNATPTIYSPPPLQPAPSTTTFSPPPLIPSEPPSTGAAAVALPAAPSIFSDPSTIGTDNTFAAFDTVFEHLTASLTGAGDVNHTASSFAPMTLALNNKQTAQLSDANLAFPATAQRHGVWAHGVGTFQSAHSQGAAPGYSGQSGGFLTGIDRSLTPDLTLGIAAGYSHTNLSQSDGTSGTIQTPRLLAYGLYRAGPIALAGTFGLAYDRIGTARPVNTGTNATEGHNGFEKNAALQAAYPLALGDMALVPHLGLQYVRLDETKFSESGAGSADLSAGGSTTQSLQPSIGASLVKPFAVGDGATLIPSVKAAYARELLDTSRNLVLSTASGTSINALSTSAAHNTVIVGPAVTARLRQSLELTANYTLTLGLGKSTAHSVMAGARLAF
ncbi:MAG TPA: autotransporter outer membrane beta-barrel domain-containing protein [Stellaceae bacterium]|jgi:outer membrane autotransporter protein|nr:autotransporter outer membrane beta-barrel domain-containing protein [Stellaceae bacterium]